MAKADSTPNGNLTAMRDPMREEIVLEMTYAIDAMIILIENALENDEGHNTIWATKETLKRISYCNSMVMFAICDTQLSTSSLGKMAGIRKSFQSDTEDQ